MPKTTGHQGIKHCVNGNCPTSEFVGVSWSGYKQAWAARIGKDSSVYIVGYFAGSDGELEAALAYNAKALELYGPGARLN